MSTHMIELRPGDFRYTAIWKRIKPKWIKAARDEGMIDSSDENPSMAPNKILVEVNPDNTPYMACEGSPHYGLTPVSWEDAACQVWWPVKSKGNKSGSIKRPKPVY